MRAGESVSQKCLEPFVDGREVVSAQCPRVADVEDSEQLRTKLESFLSNQTWRIRILQA